MRKDVGFKSSGLPSPRMIRVAGRGWGWGAGVRVLGSVLILSLMVSASAQKFPVETDSMRRNVAKTNGNVLIRNARIMTITKGTIEGGDILIQNGKIKEIGKNLSTPPGTMVIDATGKVVTPGIVDAHVHRGTQATNEGSDSITAEVRILDVLDPSAKNVWQALAGGETTGMALHGSSNCIGGESVVIKFKYGRKPSEVVIPDAPRMVKFALGENVTRSGQATSTRFPKTRMGQQAVYRRGFTEAREYIKTWDAFEKGGKSGTPPRRDLRLEALADILKQRIWVQCHSYRADEMLMMVRLSQAFGFKIGAMQHALEAYKIAPELAKAGVGVSMFVDSWSFKIEGYDAIPFNAAICSKAGVNVSINTDGTSGLPSLAIDAAKVMRYGGLSEDQAMAMITINSAKELGVDHRVGSLEVGKDGDVVIWEGHPLSVYGTKVMMTFIEGESYFERKDAFGVDKTSTIKTRLDNNQNRTPLDIRDGRTYAITGATVYPVSSAPIMDGTVVIKDGKIEAVGSDAHIPSGAIRVNGRGLHIYPGFIDAGNSIGLAEVGPIGQMNDGSELGTNQPDLIARVSVQCQSEHMPVARMGGVLASLTRPSGGAISGQASVIQNYGYTTEEIDLGKSMLAINFPGGGGGGFGLDLDACDDERTGFEEFMGGAVQGGGGGGGGGATQTEIEDFFKQAQEYSKKRGSVPVSLQMEAMIPYLEGKAPVLLRVRSAASIRNAVAFGEKLGLKIVLSGAPDAWKEADLLRSKKIPVIIEPAGKSTLSANAPANDYDPYDTTFVLPYLLAKAGVQFCFMSNENAGSFNLPVRVGQSCAYGFKPEDALRALTLSAAEILGVADRIGSIEPGKLANLVISDGDPFELTSNIVAVFVQGKPIALESKFTRLRDQYMKRLN